MTVEELLSEILAGVDQLVLDSAGGVTFTEELMELLARMELVVDRAGFWLMIVGAGALILILGRVLDRASRGH